MLEKSEFDYAVDELLERQRWVTQELGRRFQRTKPFRAEPVDPKEQIYTYETTTPEMMASLRQSMGDAIVDDYIFRVEKLIRRQRNA